MSYPRDLHSRTSLPLLLLVLLTTLAPVNPLLADTINLEMPNGLHALARFEEGDEEKPAVLLLHGFLQTHNFNTIQVLTDELSAEGYTVLAPTLTLNIDQRRISHTCDAIQTHTVDQGTAEIARWVDWLQVKGYSKPVLLGHSSGSLRLLSYRVVYPETPIGSMILLSLVHLDSWQDPQQAAEQRIKASELLIHDKNSLLRYTLSYCRNNYVAPPNALLGYLGWDREWVLKQSIAAGPQVHVILGSADEQLPPDWIETLRGEGVSVEVINGGDHFFNGTAEFELQTLVLRVLEKLKQVSN